jgi:hypothetical protein
MPKEMGISRERGISREMGMQREMGTQRRTGMAGGGHLYMQTNETQNAIVHYRRHPNGTITEVQRTSTGGSGSGVFKPISGQESAPNAFEGAASVILAGSAVSICHQWRRQFGLQLCCSRRWPAHAAGRPADWKRRRGTKRHRQITSLLSFEANALRVALVRPRPPLADAGRSPLSSSG